MYMDVEKKGKAKIDERALHYPAIYIYFWTYISWYYFLAFDAIALMNIIIQVTQHSSFNQLSLLILLFNMFTVVIPCKPQ